MAQAITNTVQNPFKSLFSGLVAPNISLPKIGPQANMSTVNGPKYGGNPLATPTSSPLSGLFNVPKAQASTIAPTSAVPQWQQDMNKVQDNFFNSNPGVPRTPAPVQPAPVGNTVSTPTTGLYAPGSPQNSGSYQQSGATPTTPVRGLFPDVASSLAYGAPAANAALGANAQKIAADAGAEIARVGGLGSRFEAGQLTTGTSPVAEGNAAVTAQTTAAQQAAIAAGANVALTGNAQALTGQSQTQSALNQAGGLTQPQVTAYGQTSFDPTTGTFAGGSNGGLPPEVMSQYAQMAATGQYSSIPSFITSNPVLNAQLNVAAKAINPGYTPVGAAGASGVLAGIPALQSANTAAEGIKNTINSYIQANPQLNPSDLAAGNLLQQWIQGKQLTDPKYQTLFNYLNEYTNTLAPILGVGGDATNLKTQISQGFVNAAARGQSITQVLDAISALSTNKIQDIQNGAVGGGTAVPNTTSGGSSTGGFAETW